jgi:hypothetical protein
MPAIPNISVVVQDQGNTVALSVAQQNVQAKYGVAIGGTVNKPVATSSPTALQAALIGGPLVEAAGLVCAAGNVVVAVPCSLVTKGTANAVQASVPNGSTTTITTVVDSTYGAWDSYFVILKCVTSGTIGTAGIQFVTSLDAGRNWSNVFSLGTAVTSDLGQPLNTVAVGGTGLRIAFGAGTMKAGDSWQFATVGPQSNGAGYAAAIAAFQASQYGVAGVGSSHVVGDLMHGGSTVADVVTISNQVQAGVALYEFQGVIVDLRDALTPTAWGGSGETEAVWISALQTATAGLSNYPRICGGSGYYNTPSPYANSAGGIPAYRRCGTWSQAVRRTQIDVSTRAGEVDLGAYSSILVNPASDPTDGFIYHDERVTPGLNASNIASLMTLPKKGAGFFQCQEPMFSTPGSQITELAIRNVVDVACSVGYATGIGYVSKKLVVQQNGTLDPIQLNIIQGAINKALNETMVQTNLVSAVNVIVSPTQNVLSTGVVPIQIIVTPEPFANSITETISLNTGG